MPSVILTDIVDLQISVLTTVPSRQGFGIPLIMSYHTVFPERARTYASLEEMTDDGFTTDSEAYRMATAVFSQNPKPSQIVVGREANTEKRKIRLTPVSPVQTTTAYSVVVNGQTATYTTDATPTAAEITAGLKTAIDALSEPVTTTDGTGTLDVESTTIADQFSLYCDRTLLSVEDQTPDGSPDGIVADIQAVQEANDTWYAILIAGRSAPVITAAAAYVETLSRLYIAATADSACKDPASTTDIAYALKALGYKRTALVYHPKANYLYPDAAWVGLMLPKDPGSATWKFKTVTGVDAVDLTTSEYNALKAKNCNVYVDAQGISMFTEGFVIGSSTYFIDLVQGIDYLESVIRENLLTRFANSDKVPFTDAGAGIIEAELRGALSLAATRLILNRDFTVTVPVASDVPMADRAARLWSGITFTATLAGAVHKVQIRGTATV